MRTQIGFTIVELMIAVLIGAILVGIAIPSYTVFVKNNCLTANVNKLVTSLMVARSEAIKRRVNVYVTAAAGGWGSGWTVWQDADDDSTMDANEDLRAEVLTCSGTTITEAGGDTAFRYRSTGFIDAAGSFDICDDRTAETGRQITVSATGRPHTESSYAGCD